VSCPRAATGPVSGLQGYGAAWSPDGTRFAYVDTTNSVVVKAPSAPERTILVLKKGQPVAYPMWSPDGSRIAILAFPPNRAIVLDAETGKTLGAWRIPQAAVSLPYPMAPLYHMAWSPDGTKVLIAWESVGVLDTETGAYTTISPSHAMAEWAPDGKGVFYLTLAGASGLSHRGLGSLFYRALDSASPTRLTSSAKIAASGYRINPPTVGLMDLSPDGKSMAFGLGATQGHRSIVAIVPIGSADTLDLSAPTYRIATGHESVFAVSWSPTGDRLAVELATNTGLTVESLALATGTWRSLDSMTIADVSELESVNWSSRSAGRPSPSDPERGWRRRACLPSPSTCPYGS